MTSLRRGSRIGTALVASALAVACNAPSTPAPLEDTQENRSAQIDRYFQAQPPEAMVREIVGKIAAPMPEDQRARFTDLMTKQLDFKELDAAMRESMAKHFTADELRALADFYGSPLGQSAMAKFGDYMADVMPKIRSQIIAAVGRVQGELAAQPGSAPGAPPAAEPPAAPAQPAPAAPPEPAKP
jgi:hypothetical protein